MATTREERKLLEDAAQIIRRELATGNDVRIRGFGQFYLSRVTATKKRPDDVNGSGVKVRVNTARFRPWEKLKAAVRQEKVVEEDRASIAPNRERSSDKPRPSGRIEW